ncbi:hypothetical protein AKJ57_06305 [candidate division MSBL1 archaeon SCGC-AAA259A05]|uniref:Uncharacterized protein n=1 Tax=candidate division MSBL1 archaeon SCGC-AAA259A05 TaxID=1698259 RepID=A0A133U3P8_9EURY|nr:hypothetical protein AKJ57_06305 [candidate division MSBL1 archaeon SCGC-AAA259A05]
MGGRRFTPHLFEKFEMGFIDKLYHKSIPQGVISSFQKSFKDFELPIVDRGFNEKLVDKVLSIGEFFSRIQTERINHYLIIFCLGVILSLAVVFGVLL